jgi:hypothetical protein
MTTFRVLNPPKLKRDYVGRTVRLLQAIENGYYTIPAGSICTITQQSHKGSHLKVEACNHCGVEAKISRVANSLFEFVEAESA